MSPARQVIHWLRGPMDEPECGAGWQAPERLDAYMRRAALLSAPHGLRGRPAAEWCHRVVAEWRGRLFTCVHCRRASERYHLAWGRREGRYPAPGSLP